MEPCVLSKSRARSPYSYLREIEKLNEVTKKMRERSGHKPRSPSTTTCDSRLSARMRTGFEPAVKTCGSLWGSISSWSPTAKRMTRFKPASKSRGSQGGCPVEPESRLPRGSSEISPETASEMLRTTNQLLQVVLQLLQRGPEVQGSRVKGAQVKKVGRANVACRTKSEEEEPEEVGCVSVACQTDAEKRSVACQTELESEETEVSGASWGFAQLKAQLEEVMVTLNNSSGYGTDLSSSLDDEESCDDTSSKSGVELFTSSPCEGHTKGNKFEQKKR